MCDWSFERSVVRITHVYEHKCSHGRSLTFIVTICMCITPILRVVRSKEREIPVTVHKNPPPEPSHGAAARGRKRLTIGHHTPPRTNTKRREIGKSFGVQTTPSWKIRTHAVVIAVAVVVTIAVAVALACHILRKRLSTHSRRRLSPLGSHPATQLALRTSYFVRTLRFSPASSTLTTKATRKKQTKGNRSRVRACSWRFSK